jgi:predicted metalloprotease with PDZ domain
MGTFTLGTFTACGVPHEVAISGRHDCDLERLTADLKRICEWQIRFFGEPAPMPHYVFLSPPSATATADSSTAPRRRCSARATTCPTPA